MSWFINMLKLTPEGKQWKYGEPWPENGMIPLGSREEIHALIARLFPKTDFSDPLWIPIQYTVGDEEWGMEIVLDHDDPVKWIGLRHGSEKAAHLIQKHTGWDVLDQDNRPIIFDIWL
jgi:hypothetical protein